MKSGSIVSGTGNVPIRLVPVVGVPHDVVEHGEHVRILMPNTDQRVVSSKVRERQYTASLRNVIISPKKLLYLSIKFYIWLLSLEG
jgi:hypothetical protein